MYCPQCSQQQISDEVRFCSRCGFPLGTVAELLAGGGLPAKVNSPSDVPQPSPRQIGMRRGAKVIFWSVVLVPMALAIAFLFDSPGPMLLPFIVFLIGIMRMIYARLFDESGPSAKQKIRPRALSGVGPTLGTALPPMRGVPVTAEFAVPKVRTAEMARPPSVTENTTKLLDVERELRATADDPPAK